MTDSNRVRLSYIAESTEGTTPSTPAMTKIRYTGESLNYGVDSIISEEIRDDRLVTDLVQVGARVSGGFNFEGSYGAFDDFIEGAMFGTWTKTPEIRNITADQNITDAGTTANTYQVASGGTAFVVGHMVRASGFAPATNNQLFRVASSTGTTVVGTSLSLTAETAPPAGARLKVVGFQGASGDITATATGLGSTSLNFTTLGLAVGQWIKIGGSTAIQQFATTALNDWVKITAITANAINVDNRPSGWTTDAGTGKTITVYMGDYLRVGTTRRPFSIEKSFLAQTTPTHILYSGLLVNQMSLGLESGRMLSGSFDFLGRAQVISTTAIGASYSDAVANEVMNAVSNVGRIAEGGSAVASPNFIRSLNVSLDNSLREQTAVGTLGLVGVGVGKASVAGSMTTYFGSKALLDKFVADTSTSLNFRVAKSTSAYVYTMPKVKLSGGRTVASQGDSDVLAEFDYTALRDATTSTNLQIDRFEEFA